MLWLIQRAAELHADKHPDAPGEVNDSTISTNVGADRLLPRFGFEECRYFFDMKRSLDQAVPEVPLADGLRLVPFDMSMDETLRVTHYEVFVDHWGSTPKDEGSWKPGLLGAQQVGHPPLATLNRRIRSDAWRWRGAPGSTAHWQRRRRRNRDRACDSSAAEYALIHGIGNIGIRHTGRSTAQFGIRSMWRTIEWDQCHGHRLHPYRKATRNPGIRS
jgi:hypothetical protein